MIAANHAPGIRPTSSIRGRHASDDPPDDQHHDQRVDRRLGDRLDDVPERPRRRDREGERDQEPRGDVVDRGARDRQRAHRALDHPTLGQDPRQHRERGDRHRHAHEQRERDELLVRPDELVERQRDRDAEQQRHGDARVRDRRGLGDLALQRAAVDLEPDQEHVEDQARGWPRPRARARRRSGRTSPGGSARSRRAATGRGTGRRSPRPSRAAGRPWSRRTPNSRADDQHDRDREEHRRDELVEVSALLGRGELLAGRREPARSGQRRLGLRGRRRRPAWPR